MQKVLSSMIFWGLYLPHSSHCSARVELSVAFNLEPMCFHQGKQGYSAVGLSPCEVLLVQYGFVKGSKHGLPNVAAVGRSKSVTCQSM